MKTRIILLMFVFVFIANAQTNGADRKFVPKFTIERPDGSVYAKIDGIEGWVILKASSNPNPFLSTANITPKSVIEENGQRIVVINETDLVKYATAQTTKNAEVTKSIFPLELQNINVYPNPTSENSNVSFTLENDKNVKIEIFTLDGKFVALLKDEMMKKGEQQISIPTNKFYTGEYLLCVTLDNARRMVNVNIAK